MRTCLAALLIAGSAPLDAIAQSQNLPQEPAQNPAGATSVERCRIAAQKMKDFEDNTRLLFESFCEYLQEPPTAAPSPQPAAAPVAKAVPPRQPPAYFVKCVVDGDPDWIEFRLVTRQQCDEMQGSPKRTKREFSPR